MKYNFEKYSGNRKMFVFIIFSETYKGDGGPTDIYTVSETVTFEELCATLGKRIEKTNTVYWGQNPDNKEEILEEHYDARKACKKIISFIHKGKTGEYYEWQLYKSEKYSHTGRKGFYINIFNRDQMQYIG